MENRLLVKMIDSTPIWISVLAIRKCWKSDGQSDSYFVIPALDDKEVTIEDYFDLGIRGIFVLGPKDAEIIKKVIKHGHESTIEHLKYTFEIKHISRAILQELARHRIASLSVQSSRYTFKRILAEASKSEELVRGILTSSGDDDLDSLNIEHMMRVADLARRKNIANDVLKYGLIEAFQTELVWTVNARSLRNFLKLRTSKRAHREIRDLAKAVYDALPNDHKFIFADCIQ